MGFVVSQGDTAAINDEVRKHQSGLGINGGGMTENGTHEIGAKGIMARREREDKSEGVGRKSTRRAN